MVRVLRFPVILAVVAVAAVAGGCSSMNSAPPAGRDGVFVHIKSGPKDPHSLLMGLRMAQMMAADRDVLVYFDVDGINAVLQGAQDADMKPFGSAQAMIQDLAAKKVGLYACPGCLKAMGKTPEQLMPGIKLAEKEAFFNFTRGRILTLDY